MKKYKLLAFDFDGTLFDTEELLFKAYQLAYYDLGYEITYEMFYKTNGFSVYDFNDIMGLKADVEKLKEFKKNYYAQFVELAKPNMHLINLLRTHNSAIVTNARKTNIEPLLKKYNLNPEYLITQEDVSEHKPSPECYNLLLKMSGIDPEYILAFEDSRPGFVAAREAGLDCVRVGEFQEDCIKNMGGGSGASTSLLLVDNSLVIKKTDNGDSKNLLKTQWEWMVDNPGDNFVPPIKIEETNDSFSYYMEYYFAPNMHEYINKIRILPKVAEILNNLATSSEYKMNIEDIRKEIFERDIKGGSALIGKKIPIKLEDIPEFVNNFRCTKYHGDSTFENILINRDTSIVLIDPTPYRNIVQGIVHDFSKLGQSLCGYETTRDRIKTHYTVEKNIFNNLAKKYLTEDEFKSLKFLTGCLYLRRMKHQVVQDYNLVEPYYEIASNLFEEFKSGDYEWH